MLPRHDDFYVVELESSYRRWCRRRRQAALIAPYEYADSAKERAAAHELLDRRPRVDALVGIFSYSGYAGLVAAKELDLAVPDDVMIACFSEDVGYVNTDPPITTVSLQPRVVSAAAVDLLADIVEEIEVDDRHRFVPTVLHIRRSTSPAGNRPESRP
jgi:DNA-binding LacI/PurR family transcriptional regulator